MVNAKLSARKSRIPFIEKRIFLMLNLFTKRFLSINSKAVFCIICTTIACFSRLAAIRHFGVNVPFVDQWDGELARLYHRLLDHDLQFSHLLLPANEHRIFLTRMLHLFLFWMNNQQMHSIHGMYAQCFVASGILAVVLSVLNRQRRFIIPSLFLTAIFMVPFSYENMFWSYQSQVYFAIFFALLGLAFAATPKIPFFATASCVILNGSTMASGMFTGAVIGMTCLWRSFQTRSWLFGCKALVHFALAYWVNTITWRNPGHEPLKAKTVRQLAYNLSMYLTWPNVPLRGAGLLAWATGGWFVAKYLLKKERLAYEQRFGLLLFTWTGLAVLAASYARSGGIANRYFDYTLLAFVAAICMSARALHQRYAAIKMALYYGALATPLVVLSTICWHEAEASTHLRRLFAVQVRKALIAGKTGVAAAYEVITENPQLGYPDDCILAHIIADPRTRKILGHLMNQSQSGR